MKNDCDILLQSAEESLHKLENCFDTAFDEKKSKKQVVGSLFGFGYSLTKLLFKTTTCAVKNTPKAVVAIAAVKRDIVNAIDEEIRESKREELQDAMDEKIKQLTLKKA